MPMTMHTLKSKPEREFQYGGRPFSETGSTLCPEKKVPLYFLR